MRCSVIILNWNGEKWLEKFLPTVVKYTVTTDCEVVVADNGSTDGSIELLKQFPFVRVIRFEENYGFAEGYNRALQQTTADYTVLLNSDVEVTQGWLTPLLDYMDAHEDVAAVQPKILKYTSPQPSPKEREDMDSTVQDPISKGDIPHFEHAGAAGGYIDMFGYPYCRGRIIGYVEEDKGQYDDTAEVFWASGACMCVRTRIFKECGGLDAGFFAHMEEIDMCWRLQCRGFKAACVPSSVIYHVGGGALDYENPRKVYLNFRNNLLMLYKNLPANRLWWVMACRFILDYTALLQSLVTGKTKNAKAIIEARRDYRKMRRSAEYKAKRKENMRLAIIKFPDIIYRGSIVLRYYLGKRTMTE